MLLYQCIVLYVMSQEQAPTLTAFEREVIRLLTENNKILAENHQLLLTISDNVRKIKGNTNLT